MGQLKLVGGRMAAGLCVALCSGILLSCGKPGPKYPSPVYERPQLPPWDPPAPPEESDPFDADALGGQWVEDSESPEPGSGEADPDPDQQPETGEPERPKNHEAEESPSRKHAAPPSEPETPSK